MASVKGFRIRASKIIEEFDNLQKNDRISIGAMDSEIIRLIKDSVLAMIENYEDDNFYFGIVEVLSEFVYDLSDEETGYQVWTNVDFSKVNEIAFGIKESLEFLKEVKDFYN